MRHPAEQKKTVQSHNRELHRICITFSIRKTYCWEFLGNKPKKPRQIHRKTIGHAATLRLCNIHIWTFRKRITGSQEVIRMGRLVISHILPCNSCTILYIVHQRNDAVFRLVSRRVNPDAGSGSQPEDHFLSPVTKQITGQTRIGLGRIVIGLSLIHI